MPIGKPHPYAQRESAKRRLASSGSTDPGPAARVNKRVSFGRKLTRGPSPAYSGPSTSAQSAGRAEEVDEIVNSSDDEEGSVDGPSQQIWSEELATPRRLRSVAGKIDGNDSVDDVYAQIGKRMRPATKPRSDPSSSFPPLPTTLWKFAGEMSALQRDEEVCRRVHQIRAQIVDFAQAYVAVIVKRARRTSVELLCSDVDNAKFIRYIGYLAQAGANGLDSWKELLTDNDCLTAIVVGIVSMALKEHVFSALWFGGTPEQTEGVHKLEEEGKDEDGYQRTKERSQACWGYCRDDSNYDLAARKVAIALRKLLTPLLHMSKSAGSKYAMPEELADVLYGIIAVAGKLSREIRMCGNVIYHWAPTFKDEEFDPERMECLNIASMIQKSPYELKKQPNGQNRSVLKGAAEKAEAIVRITAFPGLVAYRKGGGLLARELLAAEKERDSLYKTKLPPDVQQLRSMSAEPPLHGTEGFRTRVLCKSVVNLQWGQQRLLTKEAGTSRHLDAMRDGGMARYEEDREGFMELFDYFLYVHPDFDRGSG